LAKVLLAPSPTVEGNGGTGALDADILGHLGHQWKQRVDKKEVVKRQKERTYDY
jgi:hypothetical protein